MKKIIASLTSAIVMSVSFCTSVFAEIDNNAYKFVPDSSLVTFDLNISDKSWQLLKDNKSLKGADSFLNELMKSGSKNEWINIAFQDKYKKELKDHIVFSVDYEDKAIKKDTSRTDKPKTSVKSTEDILKDDITLYLVQEFKSKESVEKLKKELKDTYKKESYFTSVESKYKDADLVSWFESGIPNNFALFIDNYVVFSNKEIGIKKAAKAFYGEEVSLKDSKEFQKASENVNKEHDFQMHVNFKKIVKSLSNNSELDEVSQVLSAINMDKLLKYNDFIANFNLKNKHLSFNTFINLDKSTTETVVRHNSDFKKYTMMLPKNTLLFSAYTDSEKAGDKIKEVLDNMNKVSKKSSEKLEIEDLRKELLEAVGIDLIDFLNNLKDESVISVFNEQGGLIPGVAIILNAADKQKMISDFSKFKLDANLLEESLEKGKRKKTKSDKPNYLKFANKKTYKNNEFVFLNDIPNLGDMNIKPGYCFVGDTLVLASNEDALKSVIDRVDNKNESFSLEGNDNFIKSKTMIQNQNSAISFIDLQGIVNSVAPILSAADKKDKEMKEILSILKKFEFIVGNSSETDEMMKGEFVLSGDLVNMDFKGITSAFDKSNKALDKAEVSLVKANMYSFQVVLETYGVDYYGFQPNSSSLIKEAKAKKYWKDFKNPYTAKTGIGAGKSVESYANYLKSKKKVDFKGTVLYEPSTKLDKKTKLSTGYKIYGVDEKGNLVKDSNKKVLVLTNY